jgi:AP-1-like factor
MDFSYFGAPQQPYNHFMNINSHFPHTGVDLDTIRSVVSIKSGDSDVDCRPRNNTTLTNPECFKEPLDPILFPTSYDAFAYTNRLPTPQQGSPENVAVHTPMPVGSVDSGIGADLEDGQASRTRSSSEEKENLTPAQSRRKAQNRAAYVLFVTCYLLWY